MAGEMSEAGILRRFTAYDPPPPGFDPLRASHHLLRKHGYPHRPEVGRSIVHRHPLRTPQASYGLSGQWAGAQVNTSSLGYPPTELANTVYGQWVVPTVTPPNPDTGFALGVWVGMGGDQNNGSSQVVQAGTDARSSSNGVIYRAWTQ
jgi:Peptidase A4 family